MCLQYTCSCYTKQEAKPNTTIRFQIKMHWHVFKNVEGDGIVVTVQLGSIASSCGDELRSLSLEPRD